jgi:hypothetical protein
MTKYFSRYFNSPTAASCKSTKMDAMTAVVSWCSYMMAKIIGDDASFDPSADIGCVTIPTEMREGSIMVDEVEDNDGKTETTSKEIAENDFRLSHHSGYLVSQLIELGALEMLSARLGEKFWVTYRHDCITSLAFEKFTTDIPNPEERYSVRLAYARTRIVLRATYYEHGIPEMMRAAADARR